MKSYLYALLTALGLSLLFGTAWHTIFGYDPYVSMPENMVAIYANMDFWKGIGIWTILYSLLVTLPFTYIKNKSLRADLP